MLKNAAQIADKVYWGKTFFEKKPQSKLAPRPLFQKTLIAATPCRCNQVFCAIEIYEKMAFFLYFKAVKYIF